MHAYSEIYVAPAQVNLAHMLRYGVEDLGIQINAYFEQFLLSGVADLFGKGDYRFIVGMSGVELAYEVMWRLEGVVPQTQPAWHLEKSPVYWTGWVLAWYQWYTGQTFHRIHEHLKPDEICRMYNPRHEMDLLQFADEADRRIRERSTVSRLRLYRDRIGYSQSELADASGTSLRMIQYYEQGRKDINNAQAETILRLAAALHCPAHELLEYRPAGAAGGAANGQ